MKYLTNEHGEILQEINDQEQFVKISSGDRVIRRGSIEYLENSVAIKFHFIKLNDKACEDLYEYGNYLMTLFKYVEFGTGMLKYSNGKLIRPKRLASVLRRKRRSGTSIINKLIELDILHKHKDGKTFYYTMNPYFCLKGRRVNKSLYEEFKNTRYRDIDWEF